MAAGNIPDPEPADFYTIKRQGRFYALYENADQLIWEEGPQEDRLVCVCVYKKGAEEVRRRLVGQVQVRTRRLSWKREGEAEFAADSQLDDDPNEAEPDG